ncbi:hypothetical protein HPP92_028474 [Vanilla planifolia]|uniref:Uncharacterized protein n=1 Tax=Vanilla planifolia TaxID=51239 RepID=A0A835P940_VANPL|nr:hypothetical protein HPP92_028474 [Vanilla planifolia]
MEMEASKLSASESVTACMEVTKREKKCLKKLMAWEKQKEKLQEEIAEKRKKIAQMQQQLTELQEATRHTEVRWRQEVKAKEEALVALEEEHRAKDVAGLAASEDRKVLHLSTRHEISFRDESTRSSSKQLGLPNRDTNERDEYNDTRKVQSNIEHHINFTLRTAREEDEDI